MTIDLHATQTREMCLAWCVFYVHYSLRLNFIYISFVQVCAVGCVRCASPGAVRLENCHTNGCNAITDGASCHAFNALKFYSYVRVSPPHTPDTLHAARARPLQSIVVPFDCLPLLLRFVFGFSVLLLLLLLLVFHCAHERNREKKPSCLLYTQSVLTAGRCVPGIG